MSRILDQLMPVVRDVIINSFVNGRVVPNALRGRLLDKVGHEVHNSAVLCPDVFLGSFRGLHVGAYSFINYGCFFDLGASTYIGEKCQIGYKAMFITCTHALGPYTARAGATTTSPIIVGNGVWIGAHATILPGVTIGDGCVIAAGAVVNRDCLPNSLYAGVPAVRVRRISDSLHTVDGSSGCPDAE